MNQAANGMEFSHIEKAGREEILGYPSTRYKTRFKDNEGKGAGFMWVTDAGVPVKFEMIYSNKDAKGQRINMYFTELNLRRQDPAAFEIPSDLKPMTMGGLGAMMGMGMNQAASGETASAGTGTDPELSAKQKTCLEQAAARAAEKQQAAETKKGFARLMGSVVRTANRFGLGDLNEITRGLYDADATAEDVSVIAEELGITEDEVERCRAPG